MTNHIHYIYVVLIAVFVIVAYNYIRSKSNFFLQDKTILRTKRQHLWSVLMDYKVKNSTAQNILAAYDYFTLFPSKYDGATIVQDLDTINGLDACAMLHDFLYLENIESLWSFRGLKNKLQYDWQYGRNMEKLGISPLTAYTRSVLLIISTPIYYIIKIF